MQRAIEFLKSKAASVGFQADVLTSSGSLDEAGELRTEADEYLKAAQVLEFYVLGRDNSVAPEDIVQEAKSRNELCGAVINIRDADQGLIDMDVTFYPTKDDKSPAHQAVARVVAIMNQTNTPVPR